jgi:hypothetical protein
MTKTNELWATPTTTDPDIDGLRQAIQRDTGCGAFTAHIAAWRLEQEQQSRGN